MVIRVAINGFGRIGRCFLRRAMEYGDIEVVAINDLLAIPETAVYLFKYDSVYHKYKGSVGHHGDNLVVDGREIVITHERDPQALPWKELGIDVVIECTGHFTDKEGSEKHLKAGAKKVIISAPSKNADAVIVLGVNEEIYDPRNHHIVSLASCTTNSLAPVAKVLNDSFGIESLFITAIHSYTAGQALVDSFGKRLRRARAAAVSIIPTTTGATIATEQVLPELKGKMRGLAMRVPVLCGSVTDIVANVQKEATEEEVNDALRASSQTEKMKGILEVTDDRIVSIDIIGNSHSAIVDAISTMVLHKKVVKVLSWYDNEWGYACRLVDFTKMIGGLL
ncbi:MAG: glyceraldehyde-3-phosphate dehydrogenase [Syntrophobacter sp. DG_60]|nr:MAG: glyceraldehyde-3-phosphate dehydrogenase [Syntrophobacter sp. DG_60]